LTRISINPDLAPQFPVTAPFRDDVALAVRLPFSHDENYYGCPVCASALSAAPWTCADRG
jgi:hypothetical protein